MAVAILNFVSFAVISTIIGGDAIHGKVEGGRYYIGGHGHFAEVSPSVFKYSTFHTEWFLVTLPLVWVGGSILERQKRKERDNHAA